jgi:predicted metalloprotease with PDZ domain
MQSAPTNFTITAVDPRAHLFETTCTVDTPDPSGQAFRLPAWVPGSYLIREFARNVVTIRGECRGAAVAVRKESKDTWRAASCEGPLTVTMRVYAFDVSVRTAYLDERRAYFNGGSVFLCPVGREAEPCTVDIVRPETGPLAGARVATTLPRNGAAPFGFGRYRADDYDSLIDHPVEIADFAHVGFEAGGVRHDVTITGTGQADLARLARDLARVCQWHVELFDGAGARAPFDRYLFQVTAVGDGYGGLEHRSSTSLLCRRDELPQPDVATITDDYLTFLGLASHEYFHSWNVKRIKPAAFVPYDLSRENYTRQLWAFEGFTSYYDDLALVRCGLIEPARYLELLGRTITSVLRTPGRRVQSVAESSFDAWIKFYRQDENSPNAIVSYYAKGALVALGLDLVLRDAGASLDDVMRALWLRHGRTGVGVPEGGIAEIASEIAGRDLGQFFARFVDGTDELPIADWLAQVGIGVKLRPAHGAKDRGGRPVTGTTARCGIGAKVNADMKLAHVYADGAFERAGFAAGDQLVAVDRLKATTEVLAALVERRAPGTTSTMHAFRRDELQRREVTLTPPAMDTAWLAPDPEAPHAAVERRRAWLGAEADDSKAAGPAS